MLTPTRASIRSERRVKSLKKSSRLLYLLSAFFLAFALTSVQPTAAENGKAFTEKDRAFALNYLKETKEKFLKAVSGLSEEQWRFKPAADRWSIVEIAEHIVVAENNVFNVIVNRVLKTPLAAESQKGVVEDSSLIEFARDRSNKFKAPEGFEPSGRWSSPDEIVKEFEKVRARTASYIKTTDEDLRRHFAQSPVVQKELDGYQWMLTLVGHSERHTLQILEVKADPDFPKR